MKKVICVMEYYLKGLWSFVFPQHFIVSIIATNLKSAQPNR